MTVKVTNLWRHIGTTIEVKEASEYIPKGVYLVLGKDQWDNIELGNLLTRETTLIEEYDEEDSLEVVDYQVNLSELIEFKLALIVALVSEGWSIGGAMDLKPYMIEYDSLQKVKSITI